MAKKETTTALSTNRWEYDHNKLLPPADGGALALASGVGLPAPTFQDEDKDEDLSIAEMRKYLRLGRLKTIQDKRSPEYQDFEPGSVIVTPEKQLVALREQPFWFVPIFFYTEYCQVNDYRLKDQLPMIRARTLDPNSEIARLSRNQDTREQPDPDRLQDPKAYKIRNTEYLVFLSIIVRNSGLPPTPVAMSFSRGEYGTGQTLAGLINARQPKKLYGCVFQACVPAKQRHRSVGDWYGFDVMNPSGEESPSAWVMDPDEYAGFKALHQQLAAKHRADLIYVEHAEDEQPGFQAYESDVVEGERKFG